MFRRLVNYWLHVLLERIQVIVRGQKLEIRMEILRALGGGWMLLSVDFFGQKPGVVK